MSNTNDSTTRRYYAVCNTNGPVSARIDAAHDDAAQWEFEAMERAELRELIDDARTDAEDDLDIDGEGLSEDAFDELLRANKCERICSLENGWHLWHSPYGSEWTTEDYWGTVLGTGSPADIVREHDLTGPRHSVGEWLDTCEAEAGTQLGYDASKMQWGGCREQALDAICAAIDAEAAEA